jgi:hypothetical protein
MYRMIEVLGLTNSPAIFPGGGVVSRLYDRGEEDTRARSRMRDRAHAQNQICT